MRARAGALAPLLTFVLAACGSVTPTSSTAQTPVAIATTNILGAVVADITTCAGSSSTSLMKPGDDPHTFALASDQVAELTRTELVVANGLGLEEGMAQTLEGVRADGANVLEIGPLVDPVPLPSGEADTEPADHPAGALDPHVFLDPVRMASAAQLIGDALAKATGQSTYATCGAQTADDYRRLDQQVAEILASVPQQDRKLVTEHESMTYFAARYGFAMTGVAIPGGSTDAQPSSRQLADLVRTVRDAHVPAIFGSSTVNPKVIQVLALEVGDIKVVQLYTESLGPAGSGADTYKGMLLTDARLIAEALS